MSDHGSTLGLLRTQGTRRSAGTDTWEGAPTREGGSRRGRTWADSPQKERRWTLGLDGMGGGRWGRGRRGGPGNDRRSLRTSRDDPHQG